jgi:hypothetical protein
MKGMKMGDFTWRKLYPFRDFHLMEMEFGEMVIPVLKALPLNEEQR